MWKHEILEHKYVLLGAHSTGVSQRTEEALGAINSAVQRSVQFYFGDYNKYISFDKNLIFDEASKLFKVPYDVTAYTATSVTNGNLEKDFLLLIKTKNENFLLFLFVYAEHLMSSWGLVPAYLVFDKDCNLSNVKSIITDDSVTEDEECLMGSCVRRVLCLTALLNTKNIITKCKVPPEKLNKKRIKHHHEPYDKYYILEVVKGVPKEKYQGEVPWDYKSPENVAFHMCRGHFKTYTEDSPLFGKYAGTFWWQPQARGKAENGTITKDYSVVVNE